MAATNIQSIPNIAYLPYLMSLKNEVKLEIINALTASMIHKSKKKEQLVLPDFLDGDWGGDMPSDEYCESLRANVGFGREVGEAAVNH